MPEAVLQCEGLAASFGDTTVFSDLYLSCAPGEILALVGASGSGKTTLLRLFAGLLPIKRGSLHVASTPAMVFQDSRLLPWCTVLENVTLLSDALIDAATEVLAQIDLTEYIHSYPHELSGGMQRRVSLARAFVHTRDLLLMDEPFTGLDPHLRQELYTTVLELWSRSRPAIVLVTHDFDDAIALADRTVVLPSDHCGMMREVSMDLPRQERSLNSSWAAAKKREIQG